MHLFCNSSPHNAAVVTWVTLPQDAVLQAQTAPMWVPHKVTIPTRIPAPPWAPLSIGLQVPASLLPGIHLLWWGSPSRAAGASLHVRGPPWGHSCFNMLFTTLFTTGCRRISAGTAGTPPPSLLHTHQCLQSCSSHLLSFHSWLSAVLSITFLPS